MMKVFLITSALIVLATADTCSDCTAVVSTIAARLMTEESIAAQQVVILVWTIFRFDLQAILVGGLCPGADDPADCEANLPGLWAGIAAVLWPGYWDPTVSLIINVLINSSHLVIFHPGRVDVR